MAKANLHEFPLGDSGEWFVGNDGEMYEAINGSALSGERSEFFYKQNGPYMKVSAKGVEWVKIRVKVAEVKEAQRERDELANKLSAIQAIVVGVPDE